MFILDRPSDDAGLTLEQRWESLLPAVQYAAAHGHVVVLHAHAVNYGPLSQTGESIAYRHERSLRFFAQHRIRPLVIVGELSNGVGGIEPALTEYMREITAWDQHVMASPWRDQVLGGALYGFNAAESIAGAVAPLAQWIESHPTPTDPIDPPPPVDDLHYDRVVHLLPPSAEYAELLQVMSEAYPRRESIVFSERDALLTSPLLLNRTIFVWNIGDFASFSGNPQIFEAWAAEHFAPLPTIIYREFTN